MRAITKTLAGAHLQQALNDILTAGQMSPQDSALCSDLAYGYFRSRIRLEHILGAVLPRPQKLPQQMRIYLALAVYSMTLQAKVPDYAAIDQTVGLVRENFGRGLGNVANGALRSVQRLGADIGEPDWYMQKGRDKWQALCVFYSIPEPIGRLWLESYGEEAAQSLLKRSFSRPRTGLRLNMASPMAFSLRNWFEENATDFQRVGKAGYACAPGGMPSEIAGQPLTHWLGTGVLSYQGAGSQAILDELGIHDWPENIWDCCAGAGGKTLALLEAGASAALASDTSAARLAHLPRECGRLGLSEPNLLLADMTSPPVRAWAGNILMDAPCSGLGVLARRPDIALRRREAFSAAYEAIQFQMLESASAILRPGRKLAYMTCTLNPAENERMLAKILASRGGLEVERQWQTPHHHPWLEGMFGAVLKKKSH